MHGNMAFDSLRWDDFRIFLAASRADSFTAAARAERIEQSTVSRRVAQLERSLGAPLFDRTPSGPRLTDLGLRLAAHAERIESEVLALVDVASGHERAVEGRVALALTESLSIHIVVPHVLPALRTAHPALEVTLLTSYRAADLLHREADLALRFFRPRHGDLVAKRVATLQTAVLANRGYAHRRRRQPDRFAWIGLSAPGLTAPEGDWFDAHVGVAPAIRTNSYLTQVEMVRAGLGVAVLATSLLKLDPDLVIVELDLPTPPTLELWLVAPRSIRDVPRVAAVWTAVEDALAQL